MATAHDLGTALIKLIPETPEHSRLPAAEDRPAIASAMGVGEPQAAGGNGIATPLTESSRVLSAIKTLTSPDGLFTLEYQDPTQISMADADGRSVGFIYADD